MDELPALALVDRPHPGFDLLGVRLRGRQILAAALSSCPDRRRQWASTRATEERFAAGVMALVSKLNWSRTGD